MRVIFGDGLLGKEIRNQTGWDYISRTKDNIDFTISETYEHLLDGYDEVINCIGYTNTYDKDKESSWNINYVGVIDLVDICNKTGKKLVHISTDYVYARSRKYANEETIPIHCDNWYTYSKLLADGYIQAKSTNYLIARCSFKPRPFPWDEAWADLIGNFDYVDIIANIIIELINKRAIGLYNVGTEEKTMFDLAIRTKPYCDKVYHFKQPYNITMNVDKLRGLFFDNNI